MKVVQMLACAVTASAIGRTNFNNQLFSCGGFAGWACPGIAYYKQHKSAAIYVYK
jgi:hypothetical protein